MPSISVIMTFFNEPPILLERSVKSILNQSFTDFEYIIISGNPENKEGNTYIQKVQSEDQRVKFFTSDTKLLMTVCLNIAIRKSNAKYIALQEADDESLPTRLEKQFAFLQANPSIDVCGTAIAYIDNETKNLIVERYYPNDGNRSFNRYAAIAHPTVMAKKDNYEKFGYYSESETVRHSPDFELWVRWKIKGVQFHTINEVLFHYFQSKNNGRNKNVKPTLRSVISIKNKHKAELNFTFTDHIFLFLETMLLLMPSKLISNLFYLWSEFSQRKKS